MWWVPPSWMSQWCSLAPEPSSELRFPPSAFASVQCFAWIWVISSLSWQETDSRAGSSLSLKQRECLGWHLSNLFHPRLLTKPMSRSRTEAGLHSQSKRKQNAFWNHSLAESIVLKRGLWSYPEPLTKSFKHIVFIIQKWPMNPKCSHLAPTRLLQVFILCQASNWLFPPAVFFLPSISPIPQLLLTAKFTHSELLLIHEQSHKLQSEGLRERTLSYPVPLESSFVCVRKNTNVIREGGKHYQSLISQLQSVVKLTSAGIKGTSKEGTRFGKRRKNWERKIWPMKLCHDYYNVGDPVVQGMGRWMSEHLDGKNLPKELRGVEK